MLVEYENKKINISNSEKLLWADLQISKIKYIKTLLDISDFIIKYSKNKELTTIRYPDGVKGKSFYQKNIPDYAPEWINTITNKDNIYINLDSIPTLIWLANQAALEFHISFETITNPNPECLVFDLDPSKGQTFNQVTEGAIKIGETLEKLGIKSLIKTSGATGLQIYIPVESKYNYETARKLNEFFGRYFSEKYPHIFTIERNVKKRNQKLYFDYLQMWKGKTIIAPYSPRANANGCVSMPIEWKELYEGITPEQFNLINVKKRIDHKGDLFEYQKPDENFKNLNNILKTIN